MKTVETRIRVVSSLGEFCSAWQPMSDFDLKVLVDFLKSAQKEFEYAYLTLVAEGGGSIFLPKVILTSSVFLFEKREVEVETCTP